MMMADRKGFPFYLLPFALCLVLAPPATAQGVKIGYVNLVRVEKESVTGTQAVEALRREFEPREQEVRAAQQEAAAARERFEAEKDQLPPAQAQARVREIQAMMRRADQSAARFTEDLNLRRRELRARLISEVRNAIRAVAEAGGYDVILQEAAFARAGIDVTDQVLAEMAKRPQ